VSICWDVQGLTGHSASLTARAFACGLCFKKVFGSRREPVADGEGKSPCRAGYSFSAPPRRRGSHGMAGAVHLSGDHCPGGGITRPCCEASKQVVPAWRVHNWVQIVPVAANPGPTRRCIVRWLSAGYACLLCPFSSLAGKCYLSSAFPFSFEIRSLWQHSDVSMDGKPIGIQATRLKPDAEEGGGGGGGGGARVEA